MPVSPKNSQSDCQIDAAERLDQTFLDCIEFFYNPQCKHVRNGMLSPNDFEQQQKLKLQDVQEARSYSSNEI